MGKPKLLSKTCTKCGTYMTGASYYATKSKFFPDGQLPICKLCLREMLAEGNWKEVDRFCQWANFPFMPDKWAPLFKELGEKALDSYVNTYCLGSEGLTTLSWDEMQKEWLKAMAAGDWKDKMPAMNEAQVRELKREWGDSYKTDELIYMDNYLKGMYTTHNIITEQQRDAARTLAKLSVRISQKIEAGLDIDKDIASYDKEMKIGDFSTSSAKNISDFESVGELVMYLEKTGWNNPYYQAPAKDVVDETIANMQSYLRRLVMGETNLKESVEQRMSQIGINAAGTLDMSEEDFDKYEVEGMEALEIDYSDEDNSGEMIVDGET